MTNDSSSSQPNLIPNQEGVDFLTPEQADPILEAVAQTYRDEGWQDVRWANYMIRLRREDRILDIQVDLQGEITTEEKPAVQTAAEVGRLIAWVILLAALVLSLTLASVLGFLD